MNACALNTQKQKHSLHRQSFLKDFDNFVKFKPEEYDHMKRFNFLEIIICSQTASMLQKHLCNQWLR